MLLSLLRRLVEAFIVRSANAEHERVLDARVGIANGKVRSRGRFVDYERDSKPPPYR